MKTARTREQIVAVALDLFVDDGYDATTMEQIAERAEIGASTLYRYFPSKDLLILDPFVRSLDFGRLLDERPVDEPLDVALGAVIRGTVPDPGMDLDRFATLRRIIDVTPAPRARLWDLVAAARTDLEAAIARRVGADADDIGVALAARTTLAVYEIVGETWWSGRSRESWEAVADRILRSLAGLDIVAPAPPDRQPRAPAPPDRQPRAPAPPDRRHPALVSPEISGTRDPAAPG
jgi:AcrR family transcriptional regulator